MTDQTHCRDAFEKWFESIQEDGIPDDDIRQRIFKRTEQDEYQRSTVNLCWYGWQSAWNTRAQASAPEYWKSTCTCDGESSKVGPYWFCKKCGAYL